MLLYYSGDNEASDVFSDDVLDFLAVLVYVVAIDHIGNKSINAECSYEALQYVPEGYVHPQRL